MTSILNVAMCALLLQTFSDTTHFYVSVRFVCTSLRDVPTTYALWVHSKRLLPAFRPRNMTPSTCPPWWEVTRHVLSVGGAGYITVPSKWSHFIKGFPVTLLSVSWTRSCWACRRSNTVNTPSRHSLDKQVKTLTSNPIYWPQEVESSKLVTVFVGNTILSSPRNY